MAHNINMVAEMLRELSKAKGFQQKEVTEMLHILPQTYNGYERGRNEPPIEIIVRPSYLYDLPIDLLVQRDRLHKDSESAMVTFVKMEEEMVQMRNDFKESPNAENPLLNILLAMMQQVIDPSKTMVSESEDRSTKSHRRRKGRFPVKGGALLVICRIIL